MALSQKLVDETKNLYDMIRYENEAATLVVRDPADCEEVFMTHGDPVTTFDTMVTLADKAIECGLFKNRLVLSLALFRALGIMKKFKQAEANKAENEDE